jgi:hypothetical protein
VTSSPPPSRNLSWKRSPALLILIAALAIAAVATGVYWRRQRQKPPRGEGAVTNPASSLPPFGTKEPLRYQALRITTSGRFESGAAVASPLTTRVSIARDGDKRREDYDFDGVVISYLELAGRRLALLSSQKIYVELDAGEDLEIPANLSAEFSPDRLLNEAPSQTKYEKMGSEVLNGRKTIKYRVTNDDPTDSNSRKTETLIWIDETLQLPLRSETVATTDGEQANFTTELQNLNENVDATVFILPDDFRKVTAKDFEQELRQAAKNK